MPYENDVDDGHDGFKVGDVVHVVDRHHLSAPVTIKSFYPDIKGGVIVEPWVFGFRSWNVADLVWARKEGDE
jgi:hypothetical protein